MVFDNLKRKFREKLERNCVKSELHGETVYLGKGSIFAPIPFFGEKMKEWSQVHPAVNEDNTWNIPNTLFGGWRNLVKLLIIMALLFMAYTEYSALLGDAKTYMDGDKYVIVERNTFNKYCKQIEFQDDALYSGNNFGLNNLTLIENEG